ncbi:RNA-directed DNA polymerase (reverse transcriptase)-related family protein [Rhynchospora pubera]|uniref:RNA-directed DNA polymerase (Reverse transcriptase)-related family protein n=1 Tax=Rhynchospora pubera TaxID=906938 RepID=A0AAV8CP72_9POAL|nr:RNA-directed DNA polymerase (reverse transcriptase)-related family protein [Rhynchospora pubera]
MVRDDQGLLTGDEAVIRNQFTNYFKQLYSPEVQNPQQQQTSDEEEQNGAMSLFWQELGQEEGSKISDADHTALVRLPDCHEIKRTLMQMGPDKCPGPDGITARFYQQNWEVFGDDLVTLVRKIFEEELVPEEWLHCTVTLIPKTDEPEVPAQYRPISIGNVTYRLIMKLIANRLRKHMRRIISVEQNAFVKGRSIVDNVILVKEVLHSFNQASFKHSAFLLKADVSKAFDKLDWNFLTTSMLYLNVPSKLINLLMSSYTRAHVSININGKGNGFITPTRGLRQGCPMSPYCFIMAMEMLTRRLKKGLREGQLLGLKLAHTSPVLTHLLYADDLVLVGGSAQREVDTIMHILNNFALASGLVMNPEKSNLWFSKNSQQHEVDRVKESLQAMMAQGDEKYLGAIMQTRGSAMKTGRMILDRMRSKLAGWKAHMLTHAGRLVLLKSVIMSLPVYHMTIECVPKTIIKQMNSLMAKFFWGKTDQSRYMAPLAWKSVCRTVEEGGLGVRDLNLFGEALFMKLVWAIACDEKKLWVQTCKAKYCPQIGFWKANVSTHSSKLWRDIVHKRVFFQNNVRWRLADATTVRAIGQPWFDGWEAQQEVPLGYRKKMVNELYDFQNQHWKDEELSIMFNQSQVRAIHTIKPNQSTTQLMQDRLIWEVAKCGRYTVKEGYQYLTRQPAVQEANHMASLWHKVNAWQGVVPKVKVFLWRLLSKALMLSQNVHRRIARISPMCQRCNAENEFEMHCFFYCQGSRVVWFGSNLGLRTQELPLDIVNTLEQCTQNMSNEEIRRFSYILWEIWVARNEFVMQHKVFDPVTILKKVDYWMKGGNDVDGLIQNNTNQSPRRQMENYNYDLNSFQLLVDGSWDVNRKAGGAYVLYYGGQLKEIAYYQNTLEDPFHAEAWALRNALTSLRNELTVFQQAQIFLDCQVLVDILNEGEVQEVPSWRALEDTMEVLQFLKQFGDRN